MSSDSLRDRTAAQEAYLRQAGRAASRRAGPSGRQKLRTELAAELEMRSEDPILDELIDLGITPDTAPAFEALPLVEVAWADGEVHTEERWRVLRVATAFGLELGRPAHAQLELWLSRPPPRELLDAWYRFAQAGLARSTPPSSVRRVVEGSHEVAMAAGGLLGFGSVSGPERTAIARIHEALGLDPAGPN